MPGHRVTLKIPQAVFERANQLAESLSQPVEQVLSSRLEDAFRNFDGLPSDANSEFGAFHQLSNEVLWTIALEQTPSDLRERLTLLLALNKRLVLTPAEESGLDQLLQFADRVMLRKFEAVALLTTRGYKVIPDDMYRRV